MLEILYRIYEVADEPVTESEQPFGMDSLSKKYSHEIAMDCMICENRQNFKDTIKDFYGKDIKFAYSRKYPPGTMYCIIIGEHCYNTDRYFSRVEYSCANCGCKVTTYVGKGYHLKEWEVRNELCNQQDKYLNLSFCSSECKRNFIDKERRKCIENGLIDESFITKDTFKNSDIAGYIYKISKKSTGEFYVGQTIYAPVFRWGQHLKTERFDISGILDYQFEVIEIVDKSQNILEREKYWIQKMYKENPSKSLNISCTAGLNPEQMSFKEV